MLCGSVAGVAVNALNKLALNRSAHKLVNLTLG